MILYKENFPEGKRERPVRSIAVKLDELPQRLTPKYNTPRDREKYIKTVEQTIRRSEPYRSYVKFLKKNLNMNQCLILKNIKLESGKHYSIELHHEPFTLFDIVETVINRRLEMEESISLFKVADEVCGLHYDGKIGLVPLTKTMHELVHRGRIFIPLSLVYHDYAAFFKEYEPYFNATVVDKIQSKADLSLQCDGVVSDALAIEFVNVQGFEFPVVPDEWRDALGAPLIGEGVKNEDYVGDRKRKVETSNAEPAPRASI